MFGSSDLSNITFRKIKKSKGGIKEEINNPDLSGNEMTPTLSDSNELLRKKSKNIHKKKEQILKEDVHLEKSNQGFYIVCTEKESTAYEKMSDLTLLKSGNQCDSEHKAQKKKHKKKNTTVEQEVDIQKDEPLLNDNDRDSFGREITPVLRDLNELLPKRPKKIHKIKQKMLKEDVHLEKSNQQFDIDCTETESTAYEDISDLTLLNASNQCDSEHKAQKKKHKKKHTIIEEKELDIQKDEPLLNDDKREGKGEGEKGVLKYVGLYDALEYPIHGPKNKCKNVLVIDEDLHKSKNKEELEYNETGEADICPSFPMNLERKHKHKHKSTGTNRLHVTTNELLIHYTDTVEEKEETMDQNNESHNITELDAQLARKKHKKENKQQSSDISESEHQFIKNKHKSEKKLISDISDTEEQPIKKKHNQLPNISEFEQLLIEKKFESADKQQSDISESEKQPIKKKHKQLSNITTFEQKLIKKKLESNNKQLSDISESEQQLIKKKHKRENKQQLDISEYDQSFIKRKHKQKCKVKLKLDGLQSVSKISPSNVNVMLTRTPESGSKSRHNIHEDKGESNTLNHLPSVNENIDRFEKSVATYKNDTSNYQDDAVEETEHSMHRLLQQNKIVERRILNKDSFYAEEEKNPDSRLDLTITKHLKKPRNKHRSAIEENLNINKCGSLEREKSKTINPEELEESYDPKQSVVAKNYNISECERKGTVVSEKESDKEVKIKLKKIRHRNKRNDVDTIRAQMLKKALDNIKCVTGNQHDASAEQSIIKKTLISSLKSSKNKTVNFHDKEKKVSHKNGSKKDNDIDYLRKKILLKSLEKTFSGAPRTHLSEIAEPHSASKSYDISLNPVNSPKNMPHFKHQKRKSILKHKKNELNKIQQSLISAALKKLTSEASSSTSKVSSKMSSPMVKVMNTENDQEANVPKKKKKRKTDPLDKMTSKLLSVALAKRQIAK